MITIDIGGGAFSDMLRFVFRNYFMFSLSICYGGWRSFGFYSNVSGLYFGSSEVCFADNRNACHAITLRDRYLIRREEPFFNMIRQRVTFIFLLPSFSVIPTLPAIYLSRSVLLGGFQCMLAP